MKLKLLFFILLIFSNFILSAQKIKNKFGKVSKYELNLDKCYFDSSAAGEILYDIGEVEIEFDGATNYIASVLKRKVRIKVYDKDRFTMDNIIIPYIYHVEEVRGIKGYTYNIENGKVKKTKITKQNVFDEEFFSMLHLKKIAIPAIEDGSVIDLKYIFSSGYFININKWYFQYDIPVRYSKYKAILWELFKFRKKVNFTDADFYLDYTEGVCNVHDYCYNFEAKEIPAFKEEDFIYNNDFHRYNVSFELIRSGTSVFFNVTDTWKSVNEFFHRDDGLGLRLNLNYNLMAKAHKICKDDTSDYQKMVSIYNYMKEKTKYNGYKTVRTEKTFNQILRDIEANSAEINLMLVGLLQAADLQTCPVLLSTKGNRKIGFTPTIDDFNYLIAYVKIGEKIYLLDATEDFLPPGQLPERCFNGKGRVFYNATSSDFIDIKPEKPRKISKIYNIEIDSSVLNVKIRQKVENYSAFELRKKIKENGGEQNYIKNVFMKDINAEFVKQPIFDNVDDIDKPILINYSIINQKNINVVDDYIYINTLGDEVFEENPFLVEKREHPIDFGMPKELKVIMTYTLPNGYKVDELPDNQNFSIPDNGVQYFYSVNAMKNFIQVITKFKINKWYYQPDDYKSLKNFFSAVISKQKQKIVLKKEK